MLLINIINDTTGEEEELAQKIYRNNQPKTYDSKIIYLNNSKKFKLKKNEILIDLINIM